MTTESQAKAMCAPSTMTHCPLCGYVAGGYLVEKPQCAQELKDWLLRYESSIAKPSEWDDWGMLAGVFQAVVGREPRA